MILNFYLIALNIENNIFIKGLDIIVFENI